MQNTVLVGKDEYKMQEDESGNILLFRFNPTYKMWIELGFSRTAENKEIEQAISTILVEKVLQGIENKGLKPIEDTGTIHPKK